MKFNFTKFTLPALLLAASVPAYAQDTTQALVKLGNGNTLSWDDFAKQVDSPEYPVAALDPESTVAVNFETAKKNYNDSIAEQESLAIRVTRAQKAYTDSKAEYDNAVALASLAVGSSTKVTVSWLQDILNASLLFQDSYNDEIENGSEIFYRREKTGKKGAVILSVAFINKPTDFPTSTETSTAWESNEGDWEKFYDFITAEKINTLRIYLGPDYQAIASKTNPSATEYYTVNSFVYDEISIANQIVGAIETLANNDAYKINPRQQEIDAYNALIAEYNTPNSDGKTKLAILQEEYEYLVARANQLANNINREGTGLKAVYDTTRAAYDKALSDLQNQTTNDYIAAYNNITLTGDIIANTPIKNDYSGIIDADNHVITVTVPGNTLFQRFAGNLKDAAVNGEFAKVTDRASFANVVYANTIDGYYRYYDDNSALTTANSVGEVGFIARNKFGADLINNTVTTLNDETKVYQINVYDRTDDDGDFYVDNQSYYVNKTSDNFVNKENPAGVLAANSFFTSVTPDLNGSDNCIYYNSKNEAVCSNVVITDKDVFFCPMPLTASKVTYDRDLAQGFNSVCLPFDLNKSEISDITYLCTYKSLSEDGSKYIFTETDVLPANTPGIVFTKKAVDLADYFASGKDLSMTGSQIKVHESEAGGKSYGTFRKVAYDDKTFTGEAIYGLAPKDKNDLTKGYQFAKATGGTFPSFRMMIATPKEEATVTTRSISIVNSIGEDITASVIGITNDTDNANSLKVVGGQGEIILSADTNIDNVTVYSIDGREAAVVDVEAGIATSVNVSNGLYIVNGQKVLVK